MTPEERERFNSICVQIQNEKNYKRYEELVRDLNALVTKKERRFPEAGGNIASKNFRAIATQVIKPAYGDGPEKVEIRIPEADDLFREIRVENSFSDLTGTTLPLKAGMDVRVTLEAKVEKLA